MTTSPDCTTIEKDIVYNEAHQVYDCFLIINCERRLIGSTTTYQDGEHLCHDEYAKFLEDNQANSDTPYAPIEEANTTNTPPVTVTVHDADWTEYACGQVAIDFEAGYVCLGIENEQNIEWQLPDDLPTATFRQLETLLQYPIVRERLGLQPPTPAVTVSRWHNEYGVDAATCYRCGNAELVIEDTGSVSLFAFGSDIPLNQLDGVYNLVRLLHDPQVRAVLNTSY